MWMEQFASSWDSEVFFPGSSFLGYTKSGRKFLRLEPKLHALQRRKNETNFICSFGVYRRICLSRECSRKTSISPQGRSLHARQRREEFLEIADMAGYNLSPRYESFRLFHRRR